jgi:hypothetical protein
MYSRNDKNYWLFVESEFNRKQDEINGYKNLGISESKLKKLRFSKGDIIFTYISKIKKFSDIREILSNEIVKLPLSIKYDKNFELSIQTKLVKSLLFTDWINGMEIFDQLELMKDNSVGFILLNCPVLLKESDSKIILNAFNR